MSRRRAASCPIRRRNDDDCVFCQVIHSFHALGSVAFTQVLATLQTSPITSLTTDTNPVAAWHFFLRAYLSSCPKTNACLDAADVSSSSSFRLVSIRPYPLHTLPLTQSTMAGRIRRQVPLLLLLVLTGVAHAFFWGGHKATPAAAVGGGRFLPQAPTTTTTLSSSSAKCSSSSSSSLYAAVGGVMERPAKMPETDSGENKKVFERLFVQLSKETTEVRFGVCGYMR